MVHTNNKRLFNQEISQSMVWLKVLMIVKIRWCGPKQKYYCGKINLAPNLVHIQGFI